MARLAERIEALRSSALANLSAVAGDQSMCTIAKSGTPFPALKYYEGRVAMLRELSKAAGGDAIDPGALATIVARWAEKWPLAEQSRDWEAYLNGGDDVISELQLTIDGAG